MVQKTKSTTYGEIKEQERTLTYGEDLLNMREYN